MLIIASYVRNKIKNCDVHIANFNDSKAHVLMTWPKLLIDMCIQMETSCCIAGFQEEGGI